MDWRPRAHGPGVTRRSKTVESSTLLNRAILLHSLPQTQSGPLITLEKVQDSDSLFFRLLNYGKRLSGGATERSNRQARDRVGLNPAMNAATGHLQESMKWGFREYRLVPAVRVSGLS